MNKKKLRDQVSGWDFVARDATRKKSMDDAFENVKAMGQQLETAERLGNPGQIRDARDMYVAGEDEFTNVTNYPWTRTPDLIRSKPSVWEMLTVEDMLDVASDRKTLRDPKRFK
jgi:hypothetical protein